MHPGPPPRRLVSGLVLLCGALSSSAQELPRAAPQEAGLSPAALRRLDDMLGRAARRRQVAGGVAVLGRHGKVGYLHRFGLRDAEAQRPMADDALFRIASMTKP